MIELHVEDYCHNCPEFGADVQKNTLYAGYEEYCQTDIYCKHRSRCEHIYEYLKEKRV